MSQDAPTILEAFRWADDAGLNAFELAVLVAYLRSEGQDGPWIAWVPLDELLWRRGHDYKTLRKALDGLIERGILSCISEAASDAAARYRIEWRVLQQIAETRRSARTAEKEGRRRRGRPRKMGGSKSNPIKKWVGAHPKMGGTSSNNGWDDVPPRKPTEKPTEKPNDLGGDGDAERKGDDAPIHEPKAEPEAGRATRLTARWHPSSTDRAFAVDLGLDADALADEFRDYWIAVPGAKGTKLDWPATWRNHCRRQASRQAGRSPPRQSAMPLGAATSVAPAPPPGSMPTAPTTWSGLTADEQGAASAVLDGLGHADADGLFGGWVLQVVRDLLAGGVPVEILGETARAVPRMKGGRELLAEESEAAGEALGAVGRRFYRYFGKVARAKRDEQPPPENVVPLRSARGAD